MTSHPEPDEPTMLSAARYVDGQLSAEARVDFEARLLREPALARAVQATRELRAPFAIVRDDAPPRLPPDFAARVVVASRRLPTAAERGVDTADTGTFALARRLLIAAALILGLGLLMFAGLLRHADSGRLEAAPVQQKKLDDLDAKIRATLRPTDAGTGHPR